MRKVRTEIQTHPVDFLVSFICDRCKNEFENRSFELSIFQHIRFTGGYGSLFGDMNNIECDLCDKCMYELIGPYFRTYSEFGENDINEKEILVNFKRKRLKMENATKHKRRILKTWNLKKKRNY